MQHWTSIDEIILEYGIETSNHDLEAILNELHKKRNALHPDLFGGDFTSNDHRESYYRILDAIQVVTERLEKSILVIRGNLLSTVDDRLTKAIAKIQSRDIQITQAQVALKDNYARNISVSFQLPRITSGVAAALTGAIFAFWDNISSNPALSSLSTSSSAILIWVSLFIMSAFIFVFTYALEIYLKAHINMILSDNGLIFLLKKLIGAVTVDENNRPEAVRFSRRNLIDTIRLQPDFSQTHESFILHILSLGAFLFMQLDESTASECADIAIAKLEKRGVNLDERSNFDEWYVIPQKLVAELNQLNIRHQSGKGATMILTIFALFTLIMILVLFIPNNALNSSTTNTPSPTITATPSPTNTNTPSATITATPPPTNTNTPSATITATSSPTVLPVNNP